MQSDVFARFLDKIKFGERCWEWSGATRSAGYGALKVDGEVKSAHRLAYEHFCEEINDEWVLHHCDNPSCVRPSHLFLGDRSDNMKDAYEKGRLPQSENFGGPMEHSTNLTEGDVREIKKRLDREETCPSIAESFPQVTEWAIYKINAGTTWTHVDKESE